MKARQPAIRAQFRAHAQWIEGALADGRAHVLGAAPGIADFALYHVLWFVCGNIEEVDLLAGCDATKAWLERMAKLGHGTRTPLDAKEALAIARAARPDSVERRGGGDMSGRRPGERVTVAANDYGRDPVAGELLAIDDRAIVIRRVDPEAGDLNLHFPRAGFDVAAGDPARALPRGRGNHQLCLPPQRQAAARLGESPIIAGRPYARRGSCGCRARA